MVFEDDFNFYKNAFEQGETLTHGFFDSKPSECYSERIKRARRTREGERETVS